ncbi:transposase family protein [Streptomyces viridosporus]|uniref:HARBI1 family protein n=1 Tax=Streptomyces viridosporus TaxID=67581 RepID=UPI00331A6303
MTTSITYTATLDIPRETVLHLAALLRTERRRLRTRRSTRSLGCFKQAVMVIRWLLDGARVRQLANGNVLSTRTAYRYLHEGIALLKAQAPSLNQALDRARATGVTHLMLDGTLIETDRCRVPGPTEGVDLWWSGKHKQHGGNIQVLSTPDGFPIWTSPVQPGREHDMTCARAHGLLDTLDRFAAEHGIVTLTDTGYEGAPAGFRIPHKKPKGGQLTDAQKQFNKIIGALRALAEKANADLKVRFKALRRVSLSPGRIGDITAAALVLFQHEHGRTA